MSSQIKVEVIKHGECVYEAKVRCGDNETTGGHRASPEGALIQLVRFVYYEYWKAASK
jgi:hypothetical protein